MKDRRASLAPRCMPLVSEICCRRKYTCRHGSACMHILLYLYKLLVKSVGWIWHPDLDKNLKWKSSSRVSCQPGWGWGGRDLWRAVRLGIGSVIKLGLSYILVYALPRSLPAFIVPSHSEEFNRYFFHCDLLQHFSHTALQGNSVNANLAIYASLAVPYLSVTSEGSLDVSE